jgi:soluble lytic murein transglycosylase
MAFLSCASAADESLNRSFYEGLLTEDSQAAAALFETALDSPSEALRRAAAEQLIPQTVSHTDAALIQRLEKAAGSDSPWGAALSFVSKLWSGSAGTKDAAEYFFKQDVNQAWNWALAQFQVSGSYDLLDEVSKAALDGRIAVAYPDYRAALASFRTVINSDPGLFFTYPGLIPNLGRAFQYGSSNDEGVTLFSAWEAGLGAHRQAQESKAELNETRYLLLHYAGRIARQRTMNNTADLFTRAFALAPDDEQEDACIWYILDNVLRAQPEMLLSLLPEYLAQINDVSYIDDILDRYCRLIVSNQAWETLEAVFHLLPSRAGSVARMQYAYILGRVLEWQDGSVDPRYRQALEEEAETAPFNSAGWYYRIMSGLGDEEALRRNLSDAARSDVSHFLLGFFSSDAASFAPPYVEQYRGELSIAELQMLAAAYYEAEMYEQALKLAANYMTKPGCEVLREDLEYAQPRPFKEFVETFAEEQGIDSALLYGLLRVESAFVDTAVSTASAQGLAQLMPDTALEMAGRLARQGGPDYRNSNPGLETSADAAPGLHYGIDLHNPEVSIHLGAFYLRYLADRMENLMTALLAYNGGMGRVRRWREAAPDLPSDLFLETIDIDETRSYGKQVLASAAVYGYLYYGLTMEEVAADIYR